MARFFSIAGLILVCGFLGSMVVSGNLYKFQTDRDPAAVRASYDVTHLRGNALNTAVKERLVAGLEVHQDQHGFGVGLGHFAISKETGEKVLGCRAYNKVTMTFEAEGVAVSGEKPVMTVDGTCEYSNDLTKINPLWIPISRIFGEKPADGDFKDYERPVHLRFANVSNYWPRQWVLVGLSVHGEHGIIQVTKQDMDQLLGKPFLVNLEE